MANCAFLSNKIALAVLTLLLLQLAGRSLADTTIQFYMHDIALQPEATAVQVAGAYGQFNNYGFGSTFVIDDVLTEGPDPGSAILGRAQGAYAVASQTDNSRLLLFTAVLDTQGYQGSTLSFHGSDTTGLAQRELAVVGGTGAFRFTRGFAVIETVSQDGPNAVLRFFVTLRSY